MITKVRIAVIWTCGEDHIMDNFMIKVMMMTKMVIVVIRGCGCWLSFVLYMEQNETVVMVMMMLATHSIRNMQPRQRKHPKRETQGLKYLNAGRQPLHYLTLILQHLVKIR